jgi:hypothetical protein
MAKKTMLGNKHKKAMKSHFLYSISIGEGVEWIFLIRISSMPWPYFSVNSRIFVTGTSRYQMFSVDSVDWRGNADVTYKGPLLALTGNW